ncbi:MAG: hypothetical protein HGN29_10920 [Asgard group archaeon]|nr:hypothetical protein [Asgard group archaeon]
MQILWLSDNKLTSIDPTPFSKCKQLGRIEIDKNPIKFLDISPIAINSSLNAFTHEKQITTLVCSKKLKENIQSSAIKRIKDEIKTN